MKIYTNRLNNDIELKNIKNNLSQKYLRCDGQNIDELFIDSSFSIKSNTSSIQLIIPETYGIISKTNANKNRAKILYK